MCPTGFRYPDWNREMDMYHQRGRCSMFYRFVSVYGNQWKIRAWMATIGRRPIGRFIDGGRRIFILPNAVRSVRMILSSRMSEKAKETEERMSSRAFQSVYEIRREDPICRGIRRLPGTRLTRFAFTRWNVKWAGARREINLNPRTRELPALTRVSATHPFYCVCFTGNLV